MADSAREDIRDSERNNQRKFIEVWEEDIRPVLKKHWPLGTLALGLAAIGTGAGLAATNHPWALIPVGTSNLSMVLSLTGAVLALCSIWLWYGTTDRLNNPSRIQTVLQAALPAVAIAACGYGGVHIGMAKIAKLLPAGWTEGQSLGTQFGVGFGIGLLVGVLYSMYFAYHVKSYEENEGEDAGLKTILANYKVFFFTLTSLFGLICTVSTTVGPALSLALGKAAENTLERIAMEAIVSLSIASLALLAMEVAQTAQDKWDSGGRSRGGQAQPSLSRELTLDDSSSDDD